MDANSAAYYTHLTDVNLQNITIPTEALACKNMNCTCERHRKEICICYDCVINSMTNASDAVLQTATRTAYEHIPGPGWNDYVSDLHTDARRCFHMWRNAGKPRNSYIFEDMKVSRARFKYALHFVKQNEGNLRKESFAQKMSLHKPTESWKEICRMNSCNNSLPSSNG